MKKIYISLGILVSVLIASFLIYYYLYLPNGSCVQVVVSAANRVTGKTKVFGSPCAVPFWFKDVQNYNPDQGNLRVDQQNDTDIQDTHSKNTERIYKILTPRSGQNFPDETSITIKWEPFDNSKLIDVYIMQDICDNDEPCDKWYKHEGIKNRIIGQTKVRDVGSYTMTLDTFPISSFLIGNYRVALYRTSEPIPQLLAVSDTFTLDTLKGNNRGDKIGDFIISDISEYGVVTTGTTTVRGIFEDNEMFGNCFNVISLDAYKIPQLGIERLERSFCFNNGIPDELKNSKSTTTIQIANYRINLRAIETADTADFVRVVH